MLNENTDHSHLLAFRSFVKQQVMLGADALRRYFNPKSTQFDIVLYQLSKWYWCSEFSLQMFHQAYVCIKDVSMHDSLFSNPHVEVWKVQMGSNNCFSYFLSFLVRSFRGVSQEGRPWGRSHIRCSSLSFQPRECLNLKSCWQIENYATIDKLSFYHRMQCVPLEFVHQKGGVKTDRIGALIFQLSSF